MMLSATAHWRTEMKDVLSALIVAVVMTVPAIIVVALS
jgi:hypothetical protein